MSKFRFQRFPQLFIVSLFFIISSCVADSTTHVAPATRPIHLSLPTSTAVGQVNILAIGDWGRPNSKLNDVAGAMSDYATNSKFKFDATLLAGDNFYTKTANAKDFKNLFEDVFDTKSLDMPFYAVLGNHDYQGGKAKMELDYAANHPDSRFKLPSGYYRIDLPHDDPIVSILMLNSNRDMVSKEYWADEMVWIEAQLAEIKNQHWTIAVAHHPLFSNGAHGDNPRLQAIWGPLFQKYKLDFFVCGHDHDLQHLEIKDWSTSWVLCGGGGSAARGMKKDNRGPYSKAVNGFVHMSFTPELATLVYTNQKSETLHSFTRTRAGEITVLKNTKSDPAATNPTKLLEGLDDPATTAPTSNSSTNPTTTSTPERE